MPDGTKDEEVEIAAQRLFETMATVRRRPRPRVAEALRRGSTDKLVETSGGGVQAWRKGEGPATLFVHGWEDDNSLWGPLIDACLQTGRAVVAFDLPGHGYSPSETISVQSAAEAIENVAAALGPIDTVVAHSFGCPATMQAMANGFKVDRAVLIATPMHRQPRPLAEGEEAPKTGGRRPGYGNVPPAVMARAMEIYREKMGAPREAFDQEATAPTMTTPVLFVHSEDDDQCPAENSRVLARLWPGAELEIVDGHGHRFIAQDADVITRITDFLEGFPPR
jgi:pimeloyl-ACP methyl ester carboxylesterase